MTLILIAKGKNIFSLLCVRFIVVDSDFYVGFFTKIFLRNVLVLLEVCLHVKIKCHIQYFQILLKCSFWGFFSHGMMIKKVLLIVNCVFWHHAQNDNYFILYYIVIMWLCLLGLFSMCRVIYMEILFLFFFLSDQSMNYELHP